jgi:hypothetical protein
MFRREGGRGDTDLLTEKAKPFACPFDGYGSCPKITTRELSIERERLLKTFSNSGAQSILSNLSSI